MAIDRDRVRLKSGPEQGKQRGPNEKAGHMPDTGVVSNQIRPKRLGGRKGQRMRLTSLAPKYSKEHHQLYADLLGRAIRHPDSRNVALTGAYGVGKSSALGLLKRRRRFSFMRPVVVELSLSTLDPNHSSEPEPANPAEATRSNRIQKEIVKQLLYQLPTGRTPHSRFPRASKFSWLRAWWISLGMASVLTSIAYVTLALMGWMGGLDSRLAELDWNSGLSWGLAWAGAIMLLLAVQRAVRGRVELSGSLKAGPATVTLQPTSSSYFDQYLDEIVYFFQVSRAKIVLIEDVDRFEDALVFDTLRALNGLLNASKQIGRRVVFVYAIRDSVLEEIGRTAKPQAGKDTGDESGELDAEGVPKESVPRVDLASVALERANRTKFFDVIIPVVPFVTADNARELMMQVMSPEETGVSRALIRLAARHVADMRLIHSIRNEFEVYRDRLMDAGKRAPGITVNIVLALILLKATNPVDYEAIRLKRSSLDTLHSRWRDLVNENLEAETVRLTALKTRLELRETVNGRAHEAGQRLLRLRETMAQWVPFIATVTLATPITDAETANVDAWQRIASGEPQQFDIRNAAFSNRTTVLQLGAEQLASLLGISIEPERWEQEDLADLKSEIAESEDRIRNLRHHTWAELVRWPEFAVTIGPEEMQNRERPGSGSGTTSDESATSHEVTFDQLIDRVLPTPLAKELVRHGYLTHHFARYVSMFYGRDVGLDAADYIARYIEPGIPEYDYELDATAVSQILREEEATEDSADLFDDPSVYNVDIINYLLENRVLAAQRVAARLTRWEELERGFVDVFVVRSSQAAHLLTLMVPTWEQAIRYATVEAPVDPRQRLKLVDTVLGAVSAGDRNDLDADVAAYLTANYQDLKAITDPKSALRAEVVIGLLAESGARLASVVPLNPAARSAAMARAVYPVTEENLSVLTTTSTIALDAIRAESGGRPVYDHAIDNLADYLIALDKSPTTSWAVEDPTAFATVLTDVAEAHGAQLLGQFVDATQPVCEVPDLDDAPVDAWPALASRGRTAATFANVQAYVQEFSINDALASLLAERQRIVVAAGQAPSERLALAVDLLAARDAIAETALRVVLAESLDPGLIPVDRIATEDGNLVAPLLRAGLIADDASAFDPRLMEEWDAFEQAVSASAGFGAFAQPGILPADRIQGLLRSRKVSALTKNALVTRLVELLPESTTPGDAAALAEVLVRQKRELGYECLSWLHTVGVNDGLFIRVLAAQGDGLGYDDLRNLLAEMGGDYERVAGGGSGSVHFPVDAAHWSVLRRLEGNTISNVKEHDYPRLGLRLKTPLIAVAP